MRSFLVSVFTFNLSFTNFFFERRANTLQAYIDLAANAKVLPVVWTSCVFLLPDPSFKMPIWDPLVPAERVIQRGLAHLPSWISRWLGYRGKNIPPSRTWVVCLWGFIGAWGGVASIIAVFGHTSYFHNIHLVPPIVASFVCVH